MSDLAVISTRAAVYFNQKQGPVLGWHGHIPEGALRKYPQLAGDPVKGSYSEKSDFATGVALFQHDAGDLTTDGKLGRASWTRMLKTFSFVPQHAQFHIKGGVRVVAESFPDDGDTRLLTWEDPGGLDLHRKGGWKKDVGRKPSIIVIHWGGVDAAHCRNVLAGRGLSSHAGIEGDRVYQWLDLDYVAYHAGWTNGYSIGIDICQQPVTGHKGSPDKYLKLYRKRGMDVTRIRDATGRMGGGEFLSLDPRTARSTREYVFELCDRFGIPRRAPRGRGGLELDGPVFHKTLPKSAITTGKFSGVVGHHHVSNRKADIGLWWDSIFGGTELG